MRVYVILCHPDPNASSFNHALAITARDSLINAGHEVKYLDLYKDGLIYPPGVDDYTELRSKDHFQYDLEQGNDKFIQQIRDEQEKLNWCTHLIIIAPFWWGSLPSPVKSYFERVIAYEKSYTPNEIYENGLYKGKKVLIAVTTGTNESTHNPRGPYGTIDLNLMNYTYCQFALCGFKCLRTQPFFGIRDVSNETRLEWLQKWAEIVRKIDEREKLPFYKTKDYQNMILKNTNTKTNYQIINDLGNLTIDEAYNKLRK